MPPTSAAAIARLRATGAPAGQLRRDPSTSTRRPTASPSWLASGRRVDVAAVVNCTGPQGDVRRVADPLLDDLLATGTATAGSLGLGLRTDAGRLVDSTGSAGAAIWTLGAMRRGELWETHRDPRDPPPGRRGRRRRHRGAAPGSARPVRHLSRDLMGLPLSTTPAAAAAYNRGLDAVMRVQSGAVEAFTEAVALDPDFALAHGALAMLGHEGGADVDVRASLAAARIAVRRHGTDRERSLVDVVGARVRDCRGGGAEALVRHVHAHPRDVLAVSAAVPTIAFSGVTDVQQEAWDLVEGLAPAYGDNWWYRSLLAFVRQDQGRYDEAGAAVRGRAGAGARGRSRRARADPRVLRDRRARGRAALARPVDHDLRPAGHAPRALLLARGAARAVDRRRRRRAPAVPGTARAAGRHRGARAGRLGVAAVALRDDRLVGRARCRSRTCSTTPARTCSSGRRRRSPRCTPRSR